MLDTLNLLAGSALVSMCLMIGLQWHERSHLKKLEKDRHAKHLCTLLYAADLTTARQGDAIAKALLRTASNRGNRLATIYHNNMIHVDWTQEQLEALAPDIRALADELIRDRTMDDFHDRYAKILLAHLRDDQMLKWPASDMAFVHEYRKNISKKITSPILDKKRNK